MNDDEKAHVISARKAEEALRAAGPGYQQGYHAGLTAAARTAKTILDERDALRVRAEKAEAEIAGLRALESQEMDELKAENDRLRAALVNLVRHDEAMIDAGVLRHFVELEEARAALGSKP